MIFPDWGTAPETNESPLPLFREWAVDWESGALALRGGEPYTLEGDEAVKLWVRALEVQRAQRRLRQRACRAARQERRRGHPREPAQEDHHRDAARLPVHHGRGGLLVRAPRGRRDGALYRENGVQFL